MIKLIASDIDGTLVPEGSHEISHEYFKVIEDLKEIGIRFCACSGTQGNRHPLLCMQRKAVSQYARPVQADRR